MDRRVNPSFGEKLRWTKITSRLVSVSPNNPMKTYASARPPASSGSRAAFSLAEMLVALAVISLLVSLILPALGQTKVRSHQHHSLGNARQITAASRLYSVENQGALVALGLNHPAPTNAVLAGAQHTLWPDLLRPFVKDPGAFRAPHIEGVAFGMNYPEMGMWGGGPVRVADVARPAATVIFADAARMRNAGQWDTHPDKWRPEDERSAAWLFRVPEASAPVTSGCPENPPGVSGSERVFGRYRGRATTLFVDGHVEALRPAQIGFQFPKGHPRAFWDKQ